MREMFKELYGITGAGGYTASIDSPIAKDLSTFTGFDRESMDTGGKDTGILQYCHSAASGEIHQLASDEAGIYTLLTGETQFADGTALADRTLMQYHDTGETEFSYWRHGVLVSVTTAKFIQLAADFKGYIGYNSDGDLDDTITDIRDLIVRTPLVAYIYINSTEDELVWYADERHGIVMDGQTHLQQHQDRGFFVGSGLDITGITNNGTALADRTLMQYHDTGETEFSYWRHGVLVSVTTAKFIQLAADFKGYIGYNSDGDLDDTITDIRDLIVRTPLVAYIYINSTEDELVWYADERHGIVMDGQTHLQQHQDRGFFVGSGLDITGITNNGTTITSVGAGGCGDEDIKMFISEATTASKMFLEGAASEWRITDDDSNLALFRTAAVVYNDVSATPVLSAIGNARVVMTLIATNNKLNPLVWLVGQELHTTRGIARAKAASSYWRAALGGLPSNEFHPVGSVIINNESTGTAEVGAEGEIWYDHRFSDATFRFEGE